jgi:PncC family amidohydrolase
MVIPVSSDAVTLGTVFLVPESVICDLIEHFVPDGIDWEVNTGVEATTVVLNGASAEKRDEFIDVLRERIGPACVRKGSVNAAESLGDTLLRRERTISGAESCTGGIVAGFITAVAGSSSYFWGGFTTYANDAKIRILGVDAETIKRFGAVSKQCVEEMAYGTRRLSRTNISFAISGVAGPGGGTEEKPVGTVWIGIGTEDGIYSRKFLFDGDRGIIRRKAAITSLLLCEIAAESLMSLDTAFTWEYIC